jgi:DNA-binding NtrC family response regulator
MEVSVHAVGVLVVEDEAMIRVEAAAFFEEEGGFKVYEASNADQAVRLLAERGDIGVLFTDVEMPGSMNGLQLAHYASRNFGGLKIIVTSGRGKIEAALLPENALFLNKPYRLASVVDKLRRLAA